jgi:hypothetical protein
MLKAGFAKIDITPPADCTLEGFAFRWEQLPPGNDGAYDRLFARVVVLAGDADPAALVALDLCRMSVAAARGLRGVVAEQIHAGIDRVILTCIHTHSGPALEEPDEAYHAGAVLPESGSWSLDTPGQRYAATLPGKLRQAAAQAAGLVRPVAVRVREAPLGIAYCRRVQTEKGLRHCWNPQEQADLDPPPAPDPTCTVVVLEQVGGPRRYAIWGIGAHPVVLGKTSRVVSADFPGLACRLIEQELAGCRAVFLPGAFGNAHPWIATQEDPANLHPVASAAASFVVLLSHATRAGGEDLRIATRTLTVGKAQLDLALWRLGPAWVAAAPVELFGQLALDLRRRLRGEVLLATNSNGWTGYWPTRDEFSRGAYEIDSARRWGRQPGDAERLVEQWASLAEELR